MKKILFRGKRTINGDWVEGNLFIPDKHDTPIQILIGTDMYRIPYNVIPETVGQYTGLTDNNGKKIFEGDILSYEYGDLKKRGFVFYYDRGAKFGIKENDGHDNLTLLHDTQVRAWNIKVIGNIHDNPELLKGGEV